jgi:hypothetical protein
MLRLEREYRYEPEREYRHEPPGEYRHEPEREYRHEPEREYRHEPAPESEPDAVIQLSIGLLLLKCGFTHNQTNLEMLEYFHINNNSC